jgi:hypothetical protein
MGNIIAVQVAVEHLDDLREWPSGKFLRRLQDGATGAVLMLMVIYVYRKQRFIN